MKTTALALVMPIGIPLGITPGLSQIPSTVLQGGLGVSVRSEQPETQRGRRLVQGHTVFNGTAGV